PLVLVDGVPGRGTRPDTRPNARRSVTQIVRAGGRELRFRVSAGGFWQVHREAPAVLVGAVLDALGDVAGARVVDLVPGAGLLTVPVAGAVGEAGAVAAGAGGPRAARRAPRDAPGRRHAQL